MIGLEIDVGLGLTASVGRTGHHVDFLFGLDSGYGTVMLFVLAKKSESHKIFMLINEIDPKAFVSQSAVIGVYGEGFDKFKVRTKRYQE